jgi:hypothetical protein
MLYSHCTHTVLILHSCCTHTILTLYSHCTHTVLTLYSHCTRTVLTLYPHCTHTLLTTLYPHCTHTALILYSCCTPAVPTLYPHGPIRSYAGLTGGEGGVDYEPMSFSRTSIWFSGALMRSSWARGRLYAIGECILCSYCTHTLYSYCTHTLYSYCTRAVLVLHSYCTHTVLTLYSHSTHTLLTTLYPHGPIRSYAGLTGGEGGADYEPMSFSRTSIWFSGALMRSSWARGRLYAIGERILCSYCVHAVLIHCTHTVLTLYSHCTHTVLTLYSY